MASPLTNREKKLTDRQPDWGFQRNLFLIEFPAGTDEHRWGLPSDGGVPAVHCVESYIAHR